jgi:hypothetical protein
LGAYFAISQRLISGLHKKSAEGKVNLIYVISLATIAFAILSCTMTARFATALRRD